MNNFNQFHLKPYLMKALNGIHFKTPTPIQTRLIPLIEHGKDVIGQSATGSGKTHAFLLPIFNQVNPDQHEVQAVITSPSRELAYQTYHSAKQLAKYSSKPIKVVNYVGGTDKNRQLKKLENQQPQIVIGTPGRLVDLIQTQKLDLHTATQLVIDEADMTMDLGFLPQVDKIAAHFGDEIQMMVFSATIPQKLQPFLRKYMDHPEYEKVGEQRVINSNIDNWLISTKGKDKNSLIYNLITIGEPYLVLIFANTRKRVIELTNYLKEQGLKVASIEGGMKPRERKRIMKEIKHLKFQYVVATDLAARGIDIDGVSQVINDDIPEDLEYFVHRVGRTGRNGLHGTAMTLYTPDENKEVDELEKMGISFKPKELRNGEIVDTHSRHRRQQHRKGHGKLDPTMIGMIKKKKRHVKPGYKHKIKIELHKDDEMKRKIYNRNAIRHQRKIRRENNNY
ncbi:DEAD-box ATP-dependent RNA helicase CshB [Philodulcilactobacillus myokoensis]|uniref:DEAD-box ATP-dependent RNA helicase CshB n=1 Tax=Philodulcilactobacillus myokoensis TaxID=2929573 RepID=A0A9W6B199_9LACO|nr:DEAD/DEAH box helicase [Philodulcilactobacillus myokoensis]GLB46681.1 DEAD-box ATP-dependent RNA helicase CshB [Philodulcilactobacillus myokoensis]